MTMPRRSSPRTRIDEIASRAIVAAASLTETVGAHPIASLCRTVESGTGGRAIRSVSEASATCLLRRASPRARNSIPDRVPITSSATCRSIR